MTEKSRALFEATFHNAPSRIAQAPGRIEFIGNHTDYNGGDVLGIAVKQSITCAARYREDRLVRGISNLGDSAFEFSLDNLDNKPDASEWSRYPLGVIWSLGKRGVELERGLDFAIASDVPKGAGMSSSAALELATAYAVLEGLEHDLDRKEIVRACRYAENNYVGVPCGILDQGVSGFAREDQLVFVACKNETFSRVKLPHGTHFWIFNSGVKHSLRDSLYPERHRECGEGFAMAKAIYPDLECLADFPIEEISELRPKLAAKTYNRVVHVLAENQRVNEVIELLAGGDTDLHAVGQKLFESHYSSRDLFQNSIEELDFLVSRLKGFGEVYGARLTGGGFGGAVMAWTSPEFSQEMAEEIVKAYQIRYGHKTLILHCESGDGAHVAWKA